MRAYYALSGTLVAALVFRLPETWWAAFVIGVLVGLVMVVTEALTLAKVRAGVRDERLG